MNQRSGQSHLVVCAAEIYKKEILARLLACFEVLEELRAGDAGRALVARCWVGGVPGCICGGHGCLAGHGGRELGNRERGRREGEVVSDLLAVKVRRERGEDGWADNL
jgi:hypothetical protein